MSTIADLIIRNANIYTVDVAQPHAEAVALRGKRIVFVGSNADAEAWRGPRTELIDGQGRTLLPGLIDSHFHLLWGSLKLDDLQLDRAHSPAEVRALVQAHGAAHPEQEWLLGYQLLYSAFKEKPLDRHFLDAIFPDRPILLTSFDYHTAWANTEALRRAGLLEGRQLPPGHLIVMDPATGLATGELREREATMPVRNLIPEPDEARIRALLKKGLARAAAFGITSVHNMDGDEAQVRRYLALEEEGAMTLRVNVPYSITPETPLAELETAAAWPQRFQSSHVRTGAIKLFMDGVLESYTALMVDDYADAPGQSGEALFSAEQFNTIAVAADKLGLQIAVHACGDGAVQRTLDGYAHAQQVNGRGGKSGGTDKPFLRHRVEHIEVVHPTDIPRFAALGVTASMQPLHAPLDRQSAEVWPSRAGVARWPLSFAWRTLRAAGAHLAFGSDWPVVTMDPFLGIYAARNRQPWADGDPDHRQSLAEIIAGYTRDAAYAEHQETEKGMIRPGMLADLVLLDADLFVTADEALRNVRPVLTICDGRVVYRRE
jgi:predicted amidohydrolase YtcJ